MAKPDKYSAREDVDELEALSERLTADLRKHIRAMGSFPILSEQWCDMADVLGRVAHVSDMEAKISAGKNDATLWETEELALRYLLEDGKLNLCLRNLIEYKQYQRRTLKGVQAPTSELSEKCEKFEKGLGIVLRNAWLHVEALQTTDLPALIDHIGDVLETAIDFPAVIESSSKVGDLHQKQEILVYFYLCGLLRHIDDIHEERIMPIIRERGIFMNGVKILVNYHSSLNSTDLLRAVEALGLLTTTEDFNTYKNKYIRDESDVFLLFELRSACLTKYQDDTNSRRIARPLLDTIAQAGRQHNLK